MSSSYLPFLCIGFLSKVKYFQNIVGDLFWVLYFKYCRSVWVKWAAAAEQLLSLNSVYKHSVLSNSNHKLEGISELKAQKLPLQMETQRKHHLQATLYKASQVTVCSQSGSSLKCNWRGKGGGVLFTYSFSIFIVHLLKITSPNWIALYTIKDWLTVCYKGLVLDSLICSVHLHPCYS